MACLQIWWSSAPITYEYKLSLILLVSLLTILFTLVGTWMTTSMSYKRQLRNIHTIAGPQQPQLPAAIPYTLPYLGHAHKWGWLSPRVGEFFKKVFKIHPRSSGAFTLYLRGELVHILFSPHAVEKLFHIRNPTRNDFRRRIAENILGVNKQQFERHLGLSEFATGNESQSPKEKLEEITRKYLQKNESVLELTTEFFQSLKHEIRSILPDSNSKIDGCVEIRLCSTLRPIIFRASARALFGDKLLEICPDWVQSYFNFDEGAQSLYFGIPKWLDAKPYRAKEKALSELEKWHMCLAEESKGIIPDADGEVAWDPLFGSRYNRARQQHHNDRELTLRGRAGLDLGFFLALSSNAIPATLWMLLHVLSPNALPSLLPRVLEELKTAKQENGSLDLSKVNSLPLLQSLYNESLRLYSDTLVTRNLQDDIILPVDAKRDREILLKKGTTVMAPTWLSHRNHESWVGSEADQFDADRFLKFDPTTNQTIFSVNDTAGKLFPYGGGKTICPGRVFAKQEIIATAAIILSTFDMTFVEFCDDNGSHIDRFPQIRDDVVGSIILTASGDMKVKVKKRD